MVLRVGALLRRAQILNEHKIVIGSTEFDYDTMTVTTDKESLVLPKKEFLLLYKLAASPGRTFTKQQLMDASLPTSRRLSRRLTIWAAYMVRIS